MVNQISSYGLDQKREQRGKAETTDLTEREMQVLELLAKGGGTSSIAQDLSISNTTARNHIQNILAKLEVHTRLEAVAHALKNRLIEPV
jgi:DNA-binding NarL/FixJ family response regulator